MALGLLGLTWADGGGMGTFPPQPPVNLNQAAESVSEPEALDGRRKVFDRICTTCNIICLTGPIWLLKLQPFSKRLLAAGGLCKVLRWLGSKGEE